MNIWSVMSGLLANGIWLGLCLLAKAIIDGIRNAPAPPARHSPSRVIKAQFFGFLVGLVAALTIASVLPHAGVNSRAAFFRLVAYITAGFCFIFLWGCFDVLFAVYQTKEQDCQDPPEPAGEDVDEKRR